MALLTVSSGVLAAHWRTETVRAPILWTPFIGEMTGYVLSVEERIDEKTRMILVPQSLGSLPPYRLPARVRVTLNATPPKPGDFIKLKVRLMPPPGPARPGGYDFARESYFQKIGAVGSTLGAYTVLPPAPHKNSDIFMSARSLLDDIRNTLTIRIAESGGGAGGAVAASLVTGKRGLIPQEANTILRAAGIYHIVSISGLHMVLAAGIFFWTIRAFLALFPHAIAHWPIKKAAAVGGILGSCAYCLFSGAEVATQRALIMTVIMMMAILFNCPVLSMRNLAWAALVCLLLTPESLLGPSFQMSFAAVAALIFFGRSFYDKRSYEDQVITSYIMRAWKSIRSGALALILTSVIASFATAPFSVFHFQTFNPLGILGNALALPIIEPFVMPAAVLGILLLPLGWDRPIWWFMARLMDMVLLLCDFIAHLPYATLVIPAFKGSVLGLWVLGGLWFVLWKSRLRWGGFLPMLLGVFFIFLPPKPDLYIDRKGAGALMRDSQGALMLLGRPSGFVLEQWLRADGDSRTAQALLGSPHPECKGKTCKILHAPHPNIYIVHQVKDLEESCQQAFLLITPLEAPQGCSAPYILDSKALKARGALEGYWKNNTLHLIGEHDHDSAFAPWHPWRRLPYFGQKRKSASQSKSF
jgi:competence protein ComEC